MLPVISVARSAWRGRGTVDGERLVPEETAVAFTYNGCCYAVMMATPQDLEDFALGFSLTEGIVTSPEEIRHLEIIEADIGIELRMWLSAANAAGLNERRRNRAGPSGCGLCGIESIGEALRPPRRVRNGQMFTPAEIMRALQALAPGQELSRQTPGVHAAGFWQPSTGLVALREDVGRHNALDKLGGALARERAPGRFGMILLTSRVSVDMVQKAAAIDVPVIIAVSVPTALAVRTAEVAGITLVAIARGDGFEVFTHARRITKETAAYVG
jgi:FdhD protein